MEQYLDLFQTLLNVGGHYIIIYVLLIFNQHFQTLQMSRQLYIVKNVVKSWILLYVAIYASIDFYKYFVTNEINMNLIYHYASIYVSNDILALILVPNLPYTTRIHHMITSLFLIYTLNIDYNDITNVGQLLFIYTLFSSYTFLVNFYLGIRFLKHEKNKYLNEIIEYSRIYAYYIYKYSCFINWTIHILLLSYRAYLGVFNLHYIIYSGLLFFIVKDDLILMSWLKN
jgi:hypothetical protein